MMSTNSRAYKEWAEAYVDLQEDELLQLYIVFLSRYHAGRRLLEQSRQLWQSHGLRMAPFDFMLIETEPDARPKVYANFVLV